jgi:hypothetical protein
MISTSTSKCARMLETNSRYDVRGGCNVDALGLLLTCNKWKIYIYIKIANSLLKLTIKQ